MKDQFKYIDIEPETNYIEFVGPVRSQAAGRLLRGKVKLALIKPVKVRGITIKFKGFGRASLRNSAGVLVDIDTQLLPKVKTQLFGNKATTLEAGEHELPWVLEIPNVYPQSLMVKRASISYKLQLSIAFGLHKKPITAECPVVVLRHLLPCKQMAPLVGTKLYRHTVPGKFHYEIDCPRVICLEQRYIPLAIKYLSVAGKKPVQSIQTQLLQVEYYRRETIPKSEANLEKYSNTGIFGHHFAEALRSNPKCVRITRRKGSSLTHQISEEDHESHLKCPVLLRHEIDEHLTFGTETPLVAIYHQLQVTFQFGQKYDNIRAKIPILVTSLPLSTYVEEEKDESLDLPTPKYRIETIPHLLPVSVTNTSLTTNHQENSCSQQASDRDSINTDIRREQDIFTGVRRRAMTNASRLTTSEKFLRQSTQYSAASSSSINLLKGGHSPAPSLSAFGDAVPMLRKSASAQSLRSHATNHLKDDNATKMIQDDFLQRPIRPGARRRRLPGLNINTELANKVLSRGPRSDETFLSSTTTFNRALPSGSEVLPLADRDFVMRSNKAMLSSGQQSAYSHAAESMLSNGTFASSGALPTRQYPTEIPKAAAMDRNSARHRVDPWLRLLLQEYTEAEEDEDEIYHEEEGDDETSLYSEASIASKDAPSLNSDTTGSSGKSRQSLRSQPELPAFSPAPGLPATTALRPQPAYPARLVEEFFLLSPSSLSTNSVQFTVASSNLLSPRTGLALHRQRTAGERIPPMPVLPPPSAPLSSKPAVTNELGPGPAMRSTATVAFEEHLPGSPSSPEFHTSTRRSTPQISTAGATCYDGDDDDNNNEPVQFAKAIPDQAYPEDVHKHYLRAELPPIPKQDGEDAKTEATHRYFEDSDEELNEDIVGAACICPRHGSPVPLPAHLRSPAQPPQLPRLSLGTDFSAATLGLDQE